MRPGESAKYNSQELDKETNYYFYNARHYDPEICRFVTADTVIDNENDTQGWNRYAYVKNNPIIYKDPTGHDALLKAMGGNRPIPTNPAFGDNPTKNPLFLNGQKGSGPGGQASTNLNPVASKMQSAKNSSVDRVQSNPIGTSNDSNIVTRGIVSFGNQVAKFGNKIGEGLWNPKGPVMRLEEVYRKKGESWHKDPGTALATGMVTGLSRPLIRLIPGIPSGAPPQQVITREIMGSRTITQGAANTALREVTGIDSILPTVRELSYIITGKKDIIEPKRNDLY